MMFMVDFAGGWRGPDRRVGCVVASFMFVAEDGASGFDEEGGVGAGRGALKSGALFHIVIGEESESGRAENVQLLSF